MTISGREAERAAVLGLTSGVLIVAGEPGAGKSTLLDLAASAHEGRVLRMTGSASEANLPFAGLHQLLRPVRAELGELPERQRSALLGAVGMADSGCPDRLLVGVALLTLLSELAQRSPVLVVADDLQWLDPGSLDALAFAARRIDDEPLAVLGGTRDPAGYAGFPSLTLGPLGPREAGELLDRQPEPPVGKRRLRILDQAAGNPLALVELARAGGSGNEDVLPLTERLERVFAADLAGLPEATREALLLVAADELAAPGLADELAPAERAGLLRIAGGVRFRHPLIRSAIYHGAPLAARRRAHRELARLLAAEPDRRAWHLAAAAEAPDEEIAAALEDSASRARERGGYAAAATALERAAELSPDSDDRARRLVTAAGVAVNTGQPEWVEQLAAKASASTDDPALVARASLRVGQVLTLSAEHDTAISLLLRAADDPELAPVATASASVAGFYSGDEEHRVAVRERVSDDPWTLALLEPTVRRAELAAALPALVEQARDDPARLVSLGAMAWLLDEVGQAVRIFDDALHRWRMSGSLPTGLGCSAGWAYLDNGQWAQARLAAASATAAGAGLPHLDAAVRSLEAAALALSGDTARARATAEAGLSFVDPNRSRAVAVRTRWALGMAAVADGDHVSAYEQFRLMFTPAGDPVHYACSYAGLAELAAAAVRTGHETEAAEVVDRCVKHLDGDLSPRMSALIHRARALLDPASAEAHFEAALADPAGEQWPFERAQILLDYAEWLRRRRRITDARPKLLAAQETFRRLGARPWLTRTDGELRAAGVEASATPDALTSLTPQQQQIIRLAARGLSNREIGERLFLSPRTVGSHLYRSFPKLGVTARSQLRDLVESA
ncbi:AAA family ATPase [Amycolatopsis albispora]|uniref:LuxR family transcriptional regulator n=1 Tax=Amycolatopsis albispora TaxID=1804986 RepID=A0A344L274_9PSEU|nr:LuxR family transcriptional regulator [Amycolatopsis albispora]AXB42148.1 LuxR family transcriptional regulator [Amycolatopsis albispora]